MWSFGPPRTGCPAWAAAFSKSGSQNSTLGRQRARGTPQSRCMNIYIYIYINTWSPRARERTKSSLRGSFKTAPSHPPPNEHIIAHRRPYTQRIAVWKGTPVRFHVNLEACRSISTCVVWCRHQHCGIPFESAAEKWTSWQIVFGSFCKLGLLFVAVLISRDLLFGSHVRAPDFLETAFEDRHERTGAVSGQFQFKV